LISVLTAAYRLDPGHLADAYESLRAQKGVEWEWVIQIDGKARMLPDWLIGDPHVHVDANGAHYGVAITRNRALMRCHGEHIQNLDDDDRLTPDALGVLSSALERQPECAFAFGDGWDGDEYGAPQTRWDAPRGLIAPGLLFDRWMKEGWRDMSSPPIAPGGVMWRRVSLLAVGGWRAMTGSEDTALVMSAAENFPSIGVGAPTIIVREHARRATRSPELIAAKTTHWEFIRQQILAMRTLSAHLESQMRIRSM
jgi:glycosyltransferase involved in cell wall biosynthesis